MNSKKDMLALKQESKTYNYEKIIRLAEEIKKMTEEENRKYVGYDLREHRGVEGEDRS